MSKFRIAAILSVAGTALLASALPGQSAPLMPSSPVAKSATGNANTLQVRYGGWHGGWGHGGRGGWHGGWGVGVLAGAAIAAPYYGGGYHPYYYGEPYSDYGYEEYPAYYANDHHPYWHHHHWSHHHHHHWAHGYHHHWAHDY
jgi:hypothetical protein